MMDVLLIEPGYRNKYPPIGLMKISYFHKYIYHDYVRFAKGELPEGFKYKKWDRVYVTTLFTISIYHNVILFSIYLTVTFTSLINLIIVGIPFLITTP